MIGQAPGVADAELAADPRRSSRRVLYALSGNAPADLAIRLLTELPADARLLESIPEPDRLPPGSAKQTCPTTPSSSAAPASPAP